MVTDRYQHVLHHPTIDEFVAWCHAEKLPIIGVDNVPGSVPIESVGLPSACVLLFGQEGPGLSPEAIQASDRVVEITQYGSTRSLNASAAAAIIMHSWIREHVAPKR
jgi:tRNA G18 (ribose-2'-O)-methylase SpoU